MDKKVDGFCMLLSPLCLGYSVAKQKIAKVKCIILTLKSGGIMVHVSNFEGGARVGGPSTCHPPYHPLDFQGKV